MLIQLIVLNHCIVHSTIFKFADDLKCYLPIRTHMDSTHLQHDLNLLYRWSTENLLSFKVNKCVVLQCLPSSTSAITVYNLDNFELSKVPQHKDLGIIFTTNLTWQSHYEAITAKAYKSIGLIRRTFKNTISIQPKRTLYLTLVRSTLLYCSPLWRPNLINDISMLERIQRRATKFILNDFTSDYKERLMDLKLLPLMYTFELLDILFFIRSLKYPTPSFNISNYVTFNNSNTNIKLHHKILSNSICQFLFL